jgi:hypothetical protein
VKRYGLIFLLSLLLLQTGCTGIASSQEILPKTSKIEEGKTEKVKKYTYLRLPYTSIQEPVLIGDDLYMSINENSPSLANTIIKHNLKTKKTTKIFKSQFEDASIHTIVGNKDWLVWVDSDSAGIQNKMWAKNLKTGETQVLSESKDELITLDCPVLYQDYVAWTYVDEKRESTVHLVNLKTNEKKIVHHLHTYGLHNAFVQMNDGKLVWSDEIDKVPYYMVYDLSTKQIQSYKTSGYFPGYVELVGNQIFSINGPDHLRNASIVWTGMFDMKTGKSTKLENHFVSGLTGFGNYIAYVSDDIKDLKNRLKVFKVEKDQLKKVMVDTHPLHNPDFLSFSSDHILLVYCPVPEGNKNIATDLLIVQL